MLGTLTCGTYQLEGGPCCPVSIVTSVHWCPYLTTLPLTHLTTRLPSIIREDDVEPIEAEEVRLESRDYETTNEGPVGRSEIWSLYFYHCHSNEHS